VLVCAGSGSKASNAVIVIVHAARFAVITIASSPRAGRWPAFRRL
jgi:hypothetical protein